MHIFTYRPIKSRVHDLGKPLEQVPAILPWSCVIPREIIRFDTVI